jgi:hypothetical protein
MIAAEIPQRLGLAPVSTTRIDDPTAQDIEVKQYHVQLQFPQGSYIDVLAVEAPVPRAPEEYACCSIGRDVLKHALLIYNGMTNMYSLIF